jgi:hypothetical protein
MEVIIMAFSKGLIQRLVIALTSKSYAQELIESIEAGSNESLVDDISTNADDISTNADGIQLLSSRFIADTTDASGIILVGDLAGTESVIAIPQEDLGGDLVLSHVDVGVGQVTIYSKDVATSAVAPVDSKSFALVIV